MDLLMDGTSVGRSTFYVYFRDLNDLLGVMLDSIRDEVELTTSRVIEGQPIRTLIDEGIPALVGVWARHGAVLRAISEASAQHAELEDLYRRRFLQRGIDLARECIEAGVRSGHVHPTMYTEEIATLLVLADERYLHDLFARTPCVDEQATCRLLSFMWERVLLRSEIDS